MILLRWHSIGVIGLPGHRYVEAIGLTATLATKRSTGVTPDMNLWECKICMHRPSVNKAAHYACIE